jgi:hypothetical protein
MLAAAGLLAVAGCATQPPASQARAATSSGRLADGSAAGTPSLLKSVQAQTLVRSNCRAHEPTPPELAKQRNAIDPLRVPAVYTELFYGPRRESLVALHAESLALRPYKQFDDHDSGLAGYVLRDDASGHALVLFKGMDRPFAERDGFGGVLTDVGGVLAAKFGTGNDQLRRAEEVYTEVLCDEAIRSIELVGYSMGSPIANYLAVKYGAFATVFADMGLDSTLLKRNARGNVQAALALARTHVVSLSLSGDLLVKVFGVGDVVGTVVKLPGVLVGMLHQPEVYANAANAALRERDAVVNEASRPARADAGEVRPVPSASNHGIGISTADKGSHAPDAPQTLSPR